jgi:HdeA/HdeB family
MNGKIAAVLLSSSLVACAQTQPPEATVPTTPSPPPATAPQPAPAPAQAAEPRAGDQIVDIQRSSCQDLLRLSPEDRADASMFYIGYQASHLRARTINVGVIPSIEAQALVYCQENPGLTVAHAFAEAYVAASKW